MKTIKSSMLTEAIMDELTEYTDEVADKVKAATKTVAKETTRRLRTTSPQKTGEYGKGWASRTAYEDKNNIRIQIHNRKKPQLTHLLEDGHAKVNGGRVEGRPHIGPAEEAAVADLDKKIKEAIQQ